MKFSTFFFVFLISIISGLYFNYKDALSYEQEITSLKSDKESKFTSEVSFLHTEGGIVTYSSENIDDTAEVRPRKVKRETSTEESVKESLPVENAIKQALNEEVKQKKLSANANKTTESVKSDTINIDSAGSSLDFVKSLPGGDIKTWGRYSPIVLNFNNPVNLSTLFSYMTISPSKDDKIMGDIQHGRSNSEVIFTPKPPLEANVTYTITLNKGITTLDSKFKLLKSYDIIFTVK